MSQNEIPLPEDRHAAVLRLLCDKLSDVISTRLVDSTTTKANDRALDASELDKIREPILAVKSILAEILKESTNEFHEVDRKLTQLLEEVKEERRPEIGKLQAYLKNLIERYPQTSDRNLSNQIQHAISAKPELQYATFSFLFFSDLHLGAEGRPQLSSENSDDQDEEEKEEVEKEAILKLLQQDFEGLGNLNDRPWDLVIFGGDLFGNGAKAKKNLVSKLWKGFRDYFENLWKDYDQDKKIVAVPKVVATIGNHDLNQVDTKGPQKFKSKKYTDANPEKVGEAIAPWKEWWGSFVVYEGPEKRCYLQDGCYVAEIESHLHAQSHRVGIISLNSVYDRVQSPGKRTKNNNNRGKSTLHYEQFDALRNKVNANSGNAILLDDSVTDFDEWLERNDINLLLTHYPYQHFSDEGKGVLQRIYREGHIQLHLSGHLQPEDRPDMQLQEITHQDQKGREFKTISWTNYSLFGRQQWGAPTAKMHRPYGYSAIEIHISKDNFEGENAGIGDAAEIRIWPRLSSLKREMRFIPAISDYDLVENSYLSHTVQPLHWKSNHNDIENDISPAIRRKYEYDIAVSYSGENLETIQPILDALKKQFGEDRIFDYQSPNHRQDGIDKDAELEEIFLNKSFWIVCFHSQEYASSSDCKEESRVIRARRKEGSANLASNISVIKLDQSKIPGFKSVTLDSSWDISNSSSHDADSVANELPGILLSKFTPA